MLDNLDSNPLILCVGQEKLLTMSKSTLALILQGNQYPLRDNGGSESYDSVLMVCSIQILLLGTAAGLLLAGRFPVTILCLLLCHGLLSPLRSLMSSIMPCVISLWSYHWDSKVSPPIRPITHEHSCQ